MKHQFSTLNCKFLPKLANTHPFEFFNFIKYFQNKTTLVKFLEKIIISAPIIIVLFMVQLLKLIQTDAKTALCSVYRSTGYQN